MTERVACVKLAFEQGFQTSVSMEPMLDGVQDAERTFHQLVSIVTDKIWVGRMNKVEQRVCPSSPEVRAACERVKRVQSDKEILNLVRRRERHPKVAWKDSIQKVMAQNP